MNNKKPIKEKGGEDIGGQVVQDTTTTVPESVVFYKTTSFMYHF